MKLYLISASIPTRIAADYREYGSHQRIDSMKSMKKSVFLLFLVTTAIFGTALGDELVLTASRDNTLYEDATGRFSNGAGQFLFIGRTGDDNGLDNLARRTVIAFDLSAVPPGAEVHSATLRLTIDRVPPDATGGTAILHRLLSDWGEAGSNPFGPEGQGASAQPGDATWIHTFFDTLTWAAPGGDYTGGASALADFTNGPETIIFQSTATLVADIQSWVDAPEQNFGWIVIGDEVATMNARRLLSRENSDPGVPELGVEFTPPVNLPGPVTVPFMGVTAYFLLIVLILIGVLPYRHRF